MPPVTAERSPPLSRITGRGLAGDRRLVDGGDALDHLAVGRGSGRPPRPARCRPCAACGAGTSIQLAVRAWISFLAIVSVLALRRCRRLRLAAPLGHRLGEVGEQHGEPEPEVICSAKPSAGLAVHQIADEQDGRQGGDDLDDEHHRVARSACADRACGRRRSRPARGSSDRPGWRHVLVSHRHAPRKACRRSSTAARRSGRARAPGSR